MDKKLENYLCSGAEIAPPHMSTQKIQRIIEVRRQRRLLIAVSFAALLWMMMFVLVIVWVYRFNQIAAYAISCVLSMSVISSAVFSGLVLKFKKVGAKI